MGHSNRIGPDARRVLRDSLKRIEGTLGEVAPDVVQVNRTFLMDDLRVLLTAARFSLRRIDYWSPTRSRRVLKQRRPEGSSK